jgi:hypothetical protein
MTATMWISVAMGMWLLAMGSMAIIAAATKDADRAQSRLVTAIRRERFLAPPRRAARVIDARPAARRRAPITRYPRSYVGG